MANVNILGSSFKKLGLLVFLFILSPILLTIGFKALSLYEDTNKYWLTIAIICVAALLIIFTVVFGFLTFKAILDAFFKDK